MIYFRGAKKVKTFQGCLNLNGLNLSCVRKGEQMIRIPDLIELVQAKIPDAEVNAMDKTGMSDHFIIHVVSKEFEGKNVMERHRLVQGCLTDAMKDGRIHAAEIKTEVPA